MTREELIKEIEDYMYHIIWAHNYYDAYMSFLECLKKYREEILLSNSFFTITRYSLVSSLMMELTKLYDKREQKNLWRFLESCRNSVYIFPAEKYTALWDNNRQVKGIDELLKLSAEALTALDKTIFSLKGRRDQYYAHNDKRFFSPDAPLAEEYPISLHEVKSLLEFSSGFCNSILNVIDDRVIYPREVNSNDLDQVLIMAHKARDNI